MPKKSYAVTLVDPNSADIEGEMLNFAALTDFLWEPVGRRGRRRYEQVPTRVAHDLQEKFRTHDGDLDAWVFRGDVNADDTCDAPPPEPFSGNDWVQCSEDRKRVVNVMLPEHICADENEKDKPNLDYLQAYINYFQTSGHTDEQKRKVLFGIIALARCR